MTDSITQLCQLIAKKLRDDSTISEVELVAWVISAHPALVAALDTYPQMQQDNQHDARGFQTLVQGGTANFGNHYHLPNPEKFQAVLEAIIQKSQSPLPDAGEAELKSDVRVNYVRLQDVLKVKNMGAAESETYVQMLKAVGRDRPDWMRDHELLHFPCTDLKTIDRLWRENTDGKFGFSAQQKIYISIGGKLDGKYPGDSIWNRFCDLVGWRINERFINFNDATFSMSAPDGHLPFGWCGGGQGFQFCQAGAFHLFSRMKTCE